MLLVVGASGTGKTSWAKMMARKFPRPVLVVDPYQEWAGDPGLNRVSHWEDLEPDGINIWNPGPQDDDQLFFAQIAEGAFKIRPHQTLILDEAAHHQVRGFAPEPLLKVARFHRQLGLTLVALTQRPAWVDKAFVANTSFVVCFKVSEPNDLHYLKRLGVPLDKIRALEGHQYFVWRVR